MSISNSINRKFVESFNIDDYEILTDDGWKDCKAIHKTIPYRVWEVQTTDSTLKCADDHILFDEHMNETFVKNLHAGQLIQTQDGLKEVVACKQLEFEDNMYDIELDDNTNHRYYTNGILSHNTTTYTVFCMWLATLFSEKKILICANKLQTAIEIMDRLRRAYEQLPFWIKPGVLVYNKSEITFSNMSSIKAFSTSSSGARGTSGNVIIIDEMAFIPKNIIDDFFASVMPVISSSKNSKSIIVSTPNGASGLYYDLWQEALQNKALNKRTGWQPFQIHWWETGGIRDEAWKNQQIATIGMERWKQEYECDFLTSSSAKLIPDDVLEKYKMKLTEYRTSGIKPKRQKIISQDETELFEFDMWHEFKPTRTYLASADISEGIGSDKSVLYIWDVTDLSNITMCAKFASSTVSLVQFAFIANRILGLYGNPWLAAERNGVSAGMLDSLRITYGYKNIVAENKKHEPGIYSHVQVKGKACLWARDMLLSECFGFTIYDKDLIDELGIFVKKDTKGMHNVYHAIPGPNSHDDHVLALIWALFILNNERVQDYYIVVETITTQIGVVYAKYLQPLYEYSAADISKLTSDPLYKEFLEYQQEALSLSKKVEQKFKDEDERDIFKYKKPDSYFGDDDGDSWNNTPLSWNMQQGFQQGRQDPGLSLNGKNYIQPSFYVF